MDKIEEQIWEYLDETLNDEERDLVASKIREDIRYQAAYQKALSLHAELASMDLDEPSLSFTRKVMEDVKVLPAPVKLQTKINQNIVFAIGSFFLLAILGIFAYAVSISKFSFELPKLDFHFTSKLSNPTFLTIFVMIDVTLILLYLDSYLRRKKGDVGGTNNL